MIVITATPGLATVQDLGRHGSMRFGVGMSGAMDPLALAAANLLLGNAEDAAAIEVPIFPFSVRFTADGAFALTGADCDAALDGSGLLPWSLHHAQAGQELRLGLPQGPTPHRTARAYLALPGGVEVPLVLGSRSTQIRGAFGGLDGRALRVGDHLAPATPGQAVPAQSVGLVPPAQQVIDGCLAIRVLPAAEYGCFTPASQASFWATPWKITPQSDRYGYRLAGEPLVFDQPVEILSHGIVPGVIQVPPGGLPIIQMSDAQPSGGYPKLGTVIDADFWCLGQAPIGSQIRFVQTGWAGAVAALAERQAWLTEALRMTALWRDHPGAPAA